MSKAVAFLAGLGAGYVRGDSQRREDEARDKREAREQARFDADMAERKRVTDERDAVEAAARPVAVEAGSEFKPSQDAPAPTGDFKVGAARFATQGAADAAAADQNSVSGTRKRVMAAMASRGNVLGADQLRTSGVQGDAAQLTLEQAMKKVKDEGADRALAAALNGESPAAVEALYNAQGANKVSNLKIEQYETTHPVLGKVKTARITGTDQDGKPFELKDAQAARFNMLSAERQLDAQFKAKDSERGDKQVSIAQQQANTQEQYRRDQAKHMAAQESAAKALRDAEAKIPAAVKQQFASYDAELKVIGAAMAKAQAEGSFDPSNAGVQAMMVRQRELMAKSEALLRPYLETKGAKDSAPPDKFGVRDAPTKPAAAATGWPANAPAGSVTRPASVAANGVAAAPAPVQAPPPPAAAASPNQAAHEQALAPMADQLRTFNAALAAAAKSGDKRVIDAYAAQVNTARAALTQEAIRRLGPDGAAQYLASMQQQ